MMRARTARNIAEAKERQQQCIGTERVGEHK